MFVYAASGVRALMPDATLARLIMPTVRVQSTLISTQIARFCHHTVIFAIQANVIKTVVYS